METSTIVTRSLELDKQFDHWKSCALKKYKSFIQQVGKIMSQQPIIQVKSLQNLYVHENVCFCCKTVRKYCALSTNKLEKNYFALMILINSKSKDSAWNQITEQHGECSASPAITKRYNVNRISNPLESFLIAVKTQKSAQLVWIFSTVLVFEKQLNDFFL